MTRWPTWTPASGSRTPLPSIGEPKCTRRLSAGRSSTLWQCEKRMAQTILKRLRRTLADLLVIKSGLRDALLPRLLPTDYQLTKFVMSRLQGDGLQTRDGLVSVVLSAEDDNGQ